MSAPPRCETSTQAGNVAFPPSPRKEDKVTNPKKERRKKIKCKSFQRIRGRSYQHWAARANKYQEIYLKIEVSGQLCVSVRERER